MVNKYSIPLQSDDTDILTKFKQLKFNLQPVYFVNRQMQLSKI